VFSQLADTCAAFQTVFADYMDASADFVDDRADAALAAALLGTLPSLAGQASRYTRVNPGGTALEFRTAVQVLADLGVTLTAAQINGAGQLAGRNRIINGQGRINQRAYVSGTATVGANQYTLDRWRVVTSGQSLTYTGTDAGRTMTAPAGGCEQVIEGANIEGGTYVINWTGTATCTVDGTPRAKGATFTLTAATDAAVRMIGGTFTDVQLELGTIPTPFERVPISDELVRCQRYYEKSFPLDMTPASNTGSFVGASQIVAQATSVAFDLTIPFLVAKRVTPTVATYSPNTAGTNWAANTDQPVATVERVSYRNVVLRANSPITQGRAYMIHWVADAEL
jgi:hypothetical protein